MIVVSVTICSMSFAVLAGSGTIVSNETDNTSSERESRITVSSSRAGELNIYTENDFEKSMNLEAWMLYPDQLIWGAASMEKTESLENWMTDIESSGWITESSIEQEVLLESWMSDPTEWVVD